jgi:cobaltochelatase CobT
LTDGKPARPGRLNDLRHIVYKSFEETSQEADINLSVMLREGLLKENIDGEALLWAYSRLSTHSAERKLLVVLSDGAPVDDSTLSVNTGKFLDGHARAVISWIKHRADVELYGVGIDRDVSNFYGAGCPVLDGHRIGPNLLRTVTLAISDNWSEAATIVLPLPPPSLIKAKKVSRRSECLLKGQRGVPP